MLRYARLLIAAVLSVLPLVIALQTPAYACSCFPFSLEERVARSDLIVIGSTSGQRIIDELPTPEPGLPPKPFASGIREIETDLNVEQYLKGSGPSILALRSGAAISFDEMGQPHIIEGTTPACSFAPALETRYLLFLDRRDDGLPTVGACSLPMPIDANTESEVLALIAEIRALLQPATATSATATPTATALPGTAAPGVATATPVAGELPSTGGGAGDDSRPWPVVAAAIAGGLLLASATLAGLRGRR